MKRSLIILAIIFLCSGCFMDPYKNVDDAVSAVNAWFSYKNGDDDLGATRKKIENIRTIEEVNCKYIEDDEYLRYIYKCNILYEPIGETLIPLSKDEEIDVYVAITYNDDRTFNYIVYNSSSEDGIWLKDEGLEYGKTK